MVGTTAKKVGDFLHLEQEKLKKERGQKDCRLGLARGWQLTLLHLSFPQRLEEPAVCQRLKRPQELQLSILGMRLLNHGPLSVLRI